jgi:hypothetical protein
MEATPENDLSPVRVNFVTTLVGEVINNNATFKVYPPKVLVDDPSILEKDEAATKLLGTKWWLKFAHGREEAVSFTELMALTYNLVVVKIQLLHRQQQGAGRGSFDITFNMCVPEIMKPENVKAMLSKLDIEGIERKTGFTPQFPMYALHDGEERKARLHGCADPTTGAHIVFVFTKLDFAKQFAKHFGSGEPALIARNHEQLKDVLRRGAAQVVAFNPVLSEDRQLQVNAQVMVSTILST